MPRRQKVLFSLKRGRIRPSFNKLNIYNALTWDKTRPKNTQYRQVFFAKQETRSYHGEHLTETQFRNVFRPEQTSVSPLQSKAPRGGEQPEIPHALQTFVALERRLDFAVFRALFASSVRQAAQFIVGGAVKVNGVKIKEPSYVLKRGDMFSVDPNRVLEALGRKKPDVSEAITITNRIIRKFNKYVDKCHAQPEKMWSQREARRRRHRVFDRKYTAKEQARLERHNRAVTEDMQRALDSTSPKSVLEAILKGNFKSANELVSGKTQAVTGLIRADFPSYSIPTHDTPAQHDAASASTSSKKDTAEAEAKSEAKAEPATEGGPAATGEPAAKVEPVAKVESAANGEPAAKGGSAAASGKSEPRAESIVSRYFGDGPAPGSRSNVKKLVADISKEQQETIRNEYTSKLLTADKSRPYDPTWTARIPAKVEEIPAETTLEELEKIKLKLPFSTTGKVYGLSEPNKRWFTPWTPRQFMAPMAVLPHHIEVSFETCHAVYLRDPVARPGQSEVISPFSLDMHERAHMWYFYRRRKNLKSPDAHDKF